MARITEEQRRLDLINAAIEVIAEKGVAGATTRRIAERANSPLTMIHYCFGTKEDLFYAIFEHMAVKHFGERIHVRPAVGLGRAAATVVRQIGKWASEVGPLAQTEVELMSWMVRQDTEKARMIYNMTLEVFAAKLRVGLRPDDDKHLVDVIARIIASYGDGSVLQNLTYADKASYELCLDSMAEALERLADAHRIVPAAAIL
ncbi:TetR/AcrR family transcriptional regulator [Dietzia lutea]|uniref:HTH tetR-type domain-containing protein n=1 Tax=Dietzia lutea TaxID=546160 RepID=A0A2S1R3T9_9ACTN|nr:TetR/AcrR family transcriptional regulator [Dietzia lutea]AWH90933.1 hypothetical protein A6035_00650 [Dietzia lutea]